MEAMLSKIIQSTQNRLEFWSAFIKAFQLEMLVEIGVYRGDFAEYMLRDCATISKYYMIDPWRNIIDWNKPANTNDDEFSLIYQEAMTKTALAEHKRVVLRGTTSEVISSVQDSTIDFAYIDGDHTLKGISIDLISIWPKIKDNGFIAGDDFCSSIWQHEVKYEPTLVFPFVVYFGEAVKANVYALPNNQFLIQKNADNHKSHYVNLSGINLYENTAILSQFNGYVRETTYNNGSFFGKILSKLFR